MNKLKPTSLSFVYDGSFAGLLSCVFEGFERGISPETIISDKRPSQLLLGETLSVDTDTQKAERVLNGIIKRSNHRNASLVQVAFLSELPGVEMLLWRYLQKLFSDKTGQFWQNMLDDEVFELIQISRKVKKEVHRFNGFVRFQKTADGMYFAPIDPDHDILKLLANHFRARFADQRWIIYDTKRNYGIYYDLNSVKEVVFENHRIDFNSGNVAQEVKDLDEDFYSRLWKEYYDAINIIERQNHRQMTNLMPKRYWKYLPEKGKNGPGK
jgi:probable DNA metabolism protein